MNKHKIFLSNGTILTILADFWEIDWVEQVGTLRFFLKTPAQRVFSCNLPSWWLVWYAGHYCV